MADLYLDEVTRALELTTLKQMFVDAGSQRLYFKRLAPNDNSKNQLYLGSCPEDTRPIPTGKWSKEPGKSMKGAPTATRYILQASVQFGWLKPDGSICTAPSTKLIMYPQYGSRGEFRLSGFLDGAQDRPSTLFNANRRGREQGRVMFFGVDDHGVVLAFIAPADSRIAKEVGSEIPIDRVGVLEEISLPRRKAAVATREELLSALGAVHRLGWTDSKLLNAKLGIRQCTGPQCVGQTLLAELGVPADGRAAADYRGWEVKAYTVRSFASTASCSVTLMTPEPTGGFYGTHGAAAFLRKYGTPGKSGASKLYFEGRHKVGVRNSKRKTVLTLEGYDPVTGAIVDVAGGIRLFDEHGTLAAEWGFDQLIEHWRKKHARAVFVPALSDVGPPHRYSYAPRVHLAVGNPFSKLMDALLAGQVFYDPGVRIDLSRQGGKGVVKSRNQFRIAVPKCLTSIYEHVEHLAAVI